MLILLLWFSLTLADLAPTRPNPIHQIFQAQIQPFTTDDILPEVSQIQPFNTDDILPEVGQVG